VRPPPGLRLLLVCCALVSPFSPGAAGSDTPPFSRTERREPCARFEPLRAPHFGDTHVHTAFSFDAMGQGTRNTPRDAYRFARGEPLGIQPYDASGRALQTVQLRRPLDFAIVTSSPTTPSSWARPTAVRPPVHPATTPSSAPSYGAGRGSATSS
jgi:hypothetical protein